MGNNLTVFPPGRQPVKPGHDRNQDKLLAELLALSEEMIAELQAERHRATDSTIFLTGMIGPHEKAAGLLSVRLKFLQTDIA